MAVQSPDGLDRRRNMSKMMSVSTEILSASELEWRRLREVFAVEGFLICHDSRLASVAREIGTFVKQAALANAKRNSAMYHYNSSPRLVELWRENERVLDLATDPELLRFISFLFEDEVVPFSTINFLRSTNQPLHADSIHFGCEPRAGLGAVWFACEDIALGSGPLHVVPRSQQVGALTYSDLGVRAARSLEEAKRHYREYERTVANLVCSSGLSSEPLHLKSGDFVIWSADLVHGSPDAPSRDTTRASMVVHFHGARNKMNFVPVFSDVERGRFRVRQIEDIRTYKEARN